jgi:hypothetical protein
MQAVLETKSFEASAKAAGLTEDEKFEIIRTLAADPLKGDIIKGTGGARKLRFARKGKGKSGGYRVVTYFAGDDIPVFLLEVFAKNDKINLSKSEQNELKKILDGIAGDYRKSTRARIAQLREKAS